MFKFLDFSKLMIENRKQKNKFKNHASRHVRVVSMLEVVRVVPMHAGGCEGSVSCWRLSGGCPYMLEVVKAVSHARGCQGCVHACWRLSGQCCMLEAVRGVSMHAGGCQGSVHACCRLSAQCPCMLEVVRVVSMHAGGYQHSVHACCRLSALCLFCLCNVIQNFNFVSYFLDICYTECDGFVWFSLQKIPLCNHRIRKCCEFAQFQVNLQIQKSIPNSQGFLLPV